jgi:E3 ubiquitin-protein ligase UBR1
LDSASPSSSFHVQEQTEQSLNPVDATPRAAPRFMPEEIPPVENYPYIVAIPLEICDLMDRTIAYAPGFIPDALDYSLDEVIVPFHEIDLQWQPQAYPMQREQPIRHDYVERR